MLELRRITHDNWNAVEKLKLAKGQEGFVAPNLYSLAEAYVDLTNNEKPPMPFAIYFNDELVGFAMMEFCELDEDELLYKYYGDKSTYNLFRFMIDEKYQGKGLGREAMLKILDYLKTFPQGKADSISLSYEPTNDVARKLYVSLGFVETGYLYEEEMVARLEL
ncbi:MAG: GNAT family N-acetyltransferase [Oscillospiraceae bacterium]|nr:GNAT family N-acetyltransferase [Oscillospiraceae bacterium]MCL2279914.1 GNAT family N-acetyltransferase [Oscillospiraceae bacterium]